MSCLLVFISDIFIAIPKNASPLDSDSGLHFVLELNDSPSVEFQNVRYMEFHAGRVENQVETKSSPVPDEYQVFDTELQEPNVPIEFTVDDGTATISIICPPRIRNRRDAELLKVGSIVTGTVICLQIHPRARKLLLILPLSSIDRFNIHADPTQEVVHSLRVMQMRKFHYKSVKKDHIFASQLSASSQSCSLRRRGVKVMPIASPAKPQDMDRSLTELGSKRKEPATDENFDDSFLVTEEWDTLMNQIDKKPKLEPSSAISEDYNFGYSSQEPLPVDKDITQQIMNVIKDDGATLKEFVLAGLDFEQVEDLLAYLLNTGQIYEREGRYHLL
ncbi:hypothetical protein INT44_004994 [Umbelopsis vinacea]|uniref:Uncharacterized protein n=1 Tax=Umbelopsis vinacea TaxID=44442 RepID=A0A8H7Q8V3_9FUNG|nr:hypothetical protein INT44_004994 [Umbelopsis vinacea]